MQIKRMRKISIETQTIYNDTYTYEYEENYIYIHRTMNTHTTYK